MHIELSVSDIPIHLRSYFEPVGFKNKDLMLIPARVAIALVEDGWFLRQDIIWAKSNPMPESVSDRPTTSHEHIFLLAKQRHYYYDGEAVKEPSVYPDDNRKARAKTNHKRMPSNQVAGIRPGSQTYPMRQKRSVFNVPTKPYKGAHFAVWPEALVEPMLLASTSAKGCCPACGAPYRRITKKERVWTDKDQGTTNKNPHPNNPQSTARSGEARMGNFESTTVGWQPSCKCPGDLEPVPCTVADIFMGSGTTGAVAVKHSRSFIGIDLKGDYLTLAKERIGKVQPLLLGE